MSKAYAEANAKKKKDEEAKKLAQSVVNKTVQKANDTKKAVSDKGQSSASTNTRLSDAQYQKSYGDTKATAQRTQATTAKKNASESRLTANTTAAQRQKMGMPTDEDLSNARQNRRTLANNVKSGVRRTVQEATSEDNKGFMQRQKSGTLTDADKQKVEERSQRRTEVLKNTGRAGAKGAQDAVTGYRKSMADLAEMTASTDRMTYGQAAKLGIDKDKDAVEWAKLEGRRKKGYKQARDQRLDLQEKQDKRQAEWDERIKDATGFEKALYGAAESGTGMLVDTVVGAATGTGQFGSLASMGLRSYGTARGQAEKEGATEAEDRLYSLASAGKEVATELMFQGAGLAKQAYSKGKVGLSLADKAANALTKGLTGARADAVGAGVKVLGGTAEENIEEIAGWGLDPLVKELTYGKNVRERMKESLRSNIPQIGNETDAAQVASYFSTSKFTDDLTADYVKSGMSKDEAEQLASEMRDYYVAYYSGDQEKLDELEEDLAAKLSGQDKLSLQSWSLGELGDTLASTTLLTLATGMPGAVKTSVRGNQIFDSDEIKGLFGTDAVNKVADMVKNTSDEEMSLKAETMKDRLDSGKDLTGTQKYELWQGYMKKRQDTANKAIASEGVENKAREEQDLVHTKGFDAAGNRVYAKETQKEFNEKYASTELTVEAIKSYMESDNSISEDEGRRADAVKRAVSDLHVGGLTVGDAHEFAYGNELAREALKAEEGIDLDQYVVYREDGTVDLAATNEATENALFQLNADNAIKAAQEETEVYIDDTRGNIDKDLLTRFGNNGQAVWKEVNKDLDPRNIKEYLTTANAAEYFYSAGRNTDMSVDSAVNRFGDTFRTVDKNVMRRAFAAGARDRIIANTPGYGQTVEAGSNIALKSTKPILTGQLIMDDDVVLPDSDQSAYLALAMSTNTNIHIVSSLKSKKGAEINGMSHGNDIYLNVNAAAETNLGYVFMHEMTHQIKQYAPNEYLALENLVRDRWFNKDANGMQKAIKDRIDLYSLKGGQQLTEEEAVEEIIADAMAEAMDDPNFATEVCEESIELGNAILNSIKEALRSIRNMFANNEFKNERFHNSLLSYLGILDEAEKMWINALHQARQNKADGLIADWQESANAGGNDANYSIGRIVGSSGKDYGRGVVLDSSLFTGLTDEERVQMYRLRVNELRGQAFQATDPYGNLVDIEIVTSKKFINKNGKPTPANHDLKEKLNSNKTKQEIVDLIDEAFETAEFDSLNPATHPHDWIDDNGNNNWDTWKTYAKDGDGSIWEIPLKIANAPDGRKLLYDIEPIKEVEGASNLTQQSTTNNIPSSTNGSNTRNSISGDLTIQDGNARWTDERIDDLIERYGAKGSENYSQAYAVLMNPRDFLRITIEDELLRQWRESAASQEEGLTYKEGQRKVWDKSYLEGRLLDDQNFPLDEAELRSQTQTPFLYIRSTKSGQRVLGHEGRHRMRALMEAGVTSVPVVIEDPDTKTSKQNVDSMILGYQEDVYNGAGVVRVNDLVPIKESNRDELIQKFGGEAQVRFSLNEPVERVADLIAVHNLKPDDIRNTFELGGFPMPSIAITRDSMGHDLYGDITLMFGSDTIDPEFFRANQVFGGDAWTPTFPSISKKVSRKVADKVDQRLREILGLGKNDYQLGDLRLPALDDDNLTNSLRYNDPYDAFKNDEVFQIAYLKNAKNFDVAVPTKEGSIRSLNKQALEYLDDRLPEITYDDIYDTVDHTMQFEPAVRQARKDYYESKGGVKIKSLAKMLDEEMSYSDVMTRLEATIKYRNEGIPEVTDHEALKAKLDENVDPEGFKEWIDGLFEGIIEKTGIRNDKDMFTASGNRRSWESLHNPVTLENVVKVMRSELAAGSGILGYNPKGAAQKQYKSLDEIRGDEDRLQQLPEEEYEAQSKAAVGKMSEVCISIAEHSPKRFDNSFGAALDVGSYIAEILNSTRERSAIQSTLKKDYLLDVTDEQMDALMDAIDEIANLPTGYFEAKPRRAVGFDEVKAAIVPNSLDSDIKEGLSDRGVSLYEYDPNVEGDRTEKVNVAATEQDIRFSITVDEKKHPTVKLNKRDYAIVRKAVFAKNARIGNESEHLIDYTFTDNDFVMYETWGYDSFRPFTKFPIEGNEDEIKEIRDVIKQDKGDIDPIIESVRNRRRRNRRGSSNAQEGRASASNDRLDRQEPGSGEISNTVSGSGDIERYSITETDANGSVLTEIQSDYFAYSAARDALGRLIPFYHVTPMGGFTIFDPSYSFDETSISFSNDLNFALNYSSEDGNPEDWAMAEMTRLGDVETEDDVLGHYKVYLDMRNPLIVTDDMFEDMSIYEWPAYAKANGYDGVIHRDFDGEGADIYQVFSSSQIKDTRNENPTENPDIRYSIVDEDEAMSHIAHDYAYDNSYEALAYYENLIAADTSTETTYERAKSFIAKDVDDFYAGLTRYADGMKFDDPVLEAGRVRMARSKQDYFNSNKAKWNQNWLTEGEVLDINSVKKAVKELVTANMQNSNTSRKYRIDLVNKMTLDMRLAYYYAKQGRTDVADALLWHSAFRMVDGAEFYEDDGNYETYKNLRDYFRDTKIQLGEEYWSDTDYSAFRKANFGRLNLVRGDSNLDKILDDLYHENPNGTVEGIAVEWFNPEAFEKNDHKIDSVPDILLQIADVLDTVEPYAEAYSSEYCAEWATYIASDLLDIMQNGKELQSIADRYTNKYEAQIKAMKARHAEAMLKVRQQRDKGIRAERAKFKEYKEQQKEKKAHSKYFDSIQKSYKTLTDRLLTNTADKHIPEQYKRELAKLLSAFDFQTVGSKKLEAKRGYKSQATLKMGALKNTLEAMSQDNRTKLFYVNDSITDIIDSLSDVEGKTIDELSASQLHEIDKLLKALLHEFNTYESVRVGIKRQQAADIGRAQVESDLRHAEKFGAAKDYQNALGRINKLINMDEMTPAYMFKRIDPDKEGLGLMYGEIRRSFDKYVRNTNQLNQWMEEIVGKYHDKGILWNKYGSGELTNWRSTNYQQTFNLENGDVTLTPAQMMSLYCLSKRPQAYGHMVGAGIVVAPVNFQSKQMSDIKPRADMSLPVILTDADIKQIVSALTPEQIDVANKLQELMATKMAAWGNDASMRVLGIDLFTEINYFPIRSDKAALTRELNDNDFVEAIRNFGFTKAVQPGARNAIMVDDIFDVVTEHCNNMNLYNAYSEAMNDFMKVYNYRHFTEDGREYTVQQSVAHAYSRNTTTYIMNLMRDLNGNVSGRSSGIEDTMNKYLANAKKASVFANGRVALQQPTAIARAFNVINPKYLKGVKIENGAMDEMFEHCPIAMWKSWGYYDINMGRSIEDVIMNNGSWIEDKATDIYGALDNVTWTAIWQMVKAEMKDTHPNVKVGTEEYWDLCNERMSEIVDFTQVVDSPLHRSDAMRNKSFVVKMFTSFMAEPTLTFNMVRDGFVDSLEAWKTGNKGESSKIFSRTLAVFVGQAALVSAAAAIWDAVRGKNPGDDDDEEDPSRIRLWWLNTIENFKDNINLLNNIYYVKEVVPMFQAAITGGNIWEPQNLALQGWYDTAIGLQQWMKKMNGDSKKSWWDIDMKLFGGLGNLTGIPVKTLMRDGMAIYKMFGFNSEAVNKLTSEGTSDKSFDSDDVEDGSIAKNFLRLFSSEKEEAPETSAAVSSEDIVARVNTNRIAAEARFDKLSAKAAEKAEGASGRDRDKILWDVICDGYTKSVASGNMATIQAMKDAFVENGGDADWFDAKITEEMKSAYKKTLYSSSEVVPGASLRQENMMNYMLDHGVTEAEISDIVYHSATARDLKAAMRIGKEEYILDELVPLVQAGLTREDYEKLYKYRNYGAKDYDGKYTDEKYTKTTGTFIWPTTGSITSHFGYRTAPTAGASTNHPSIDIGAPSGTTVVAADGGVVITAGWNGGYGNSVGIKHANGMVTYYNHLSAWNVNVGDQVGQGQAIANVGSTGISTGPHLDFKILDADGNPVDPEQYLN